jgi:hypothetical protein
MMSWKNRKNSAFGVAETTHLKPNQVYINKQMAFAQFYLLQTAYPKVIYNKSYLPDGWSNKVVGAIGIQGNDINQAARYMTPPQIPADVWISIEKTKSLTMELMGANDAALGDIQSPDNKSAYIAVKDTAIAPLRNPQQRLYQMMCDTGLIWMDMFLSHYPEDRKITIEYDGQPVQVPFDKKPYQDLVYDCYIEVGESQRYSELSSVMTLDNLLQSGKITFSQYLDQIPPGYIPNKEKLIPQVRMAEEQQQQLQAAMQQSQMGGMQ